MGGHLFFRCHPYIKSTTVLSDIEWNAETSDEPPGWYYATVKEYFANGQALVEYTDSSTIDVY